MVRKWKTAELFQRLRNIEEKEGRTPNTGDVRRYNAETKGMKKVEGANPALQTYRNRLADDRGWADVIEKYEAWKKSGDIADEDKKSNDKTFAEEMRDY